jgi:hypothetical protein
MLFRETVAVYRENHTEHTNTLCGQNVECLLVFVLYFPYYQHRRLAWNGKVVIIELERSWKDVIVA